MVTRLSLVLILLCVLQFTYCRSTALAVDSRATDSKSSDFPRCFESNQWAIIKIDIINEPIQSLPFYTNSCLIIHAGSNYFQLINSNQWQLITNAVAFLNKEDIKQPFDVTLPTNLFGEVIICPIRIADNVGAYWAGSSNKLYRRIENIWYRFPTEYAPLTIADKLNAIFEDSNGVLWFDIVSTNHHYLARYTPPDQTPSISWVTNLPAQISSNTLRVQIRIKGATNLYAVLSKCDGNPWKQRITNQPVYTIVFNDLTNGFHSCRFRVIDRWIRSSTQLQHDFAVKLHDMAEIRALLEQLSSQDFGKCELAAHALILIGEPALSELKNAREKANADLHWWLNAVIQRIEAQIKSNLEKEKEIYSQIPEKDTFGLSIGQETSQILSALDNTSDAKLVDTEKLERTRHNIISRWRMIFGIEPVFINKPGSPEDLGDLATALNSLSGYFYEVK